MSEISSLGEFGLIRRLTEGLRAVDDSTVKAVGDDAAVLRYPADTDVLVTTDMLLEGPHFDLTYVPLKHLGYKAVAVNLSDIYSMCGTPRQITVSLGISSRFTVEHIEELYAGMRIACERYGVDIIGGDTCASRQGLVISITCLGTVPRGMAVGRDTARPTDLIYVSGDLGGAYMGLQLLEREKAVSAGQRDFTPDFAGKEYIIERQLKPEPRRDVVEALAGAGVRPTSMIDVSDGLSSELLHICHASHTGCRVYEDRIPIDYQTAVMAEELNMNLVTAALNGGEDYELLFTVPLVDREKMEHVPGVKLIGYITEADKGCALVTRDDSEMELRAQGWNPLAAPSESSQSSESSEPSPGPSAPRD